MYENEDEDEDDGRKNTIDKLNNCSVALSAVVGWK